MMTFKNYQTMLHVLPNLKEMTQILMEAAQNSECIETLLNRLNNINNNIQEMAENAIRLVHQPDCISPLIDSLQDLAQYSSGLSMAATKSDYENLILRICDYHLVIVNFVHGVEDMKRIVAEKDDHGLFGTACA